MPQKTRKNKNHKKRQHAQKQAKQNSSSISPAENEEAAEDDSTADEADLAASKDLPYKILNSEIVGRYMVARRDLKPGEMLITEDPLAIGPCVSAEPVCLGCYVPVELKATQYRCPSCRWPMCSPKCRGLHQVTGHTLEECQLLAAQNCSSQLLSTTSIATLKNLYELVLIVRILLMKLHEPDRYAQILRMQSHTEERKQNTELWQYYETNVVRRLRVDWKLSDFTPEEIHRICGILDVNCFEIGQLSAKARCLYPSCFFLAHDCSPNTSHTDDPNTFAILLRTSRKVYKDEALTLSYAYTLQGTLKRREFMHAGKLFWCRCQRCADPRELDTDCSTINCPKCNKGGVRSKDPLEQEAQWCCDNCDYLMKSTDVVKLLDKINYDLESQDVHNVDGLENFLKRYSTVLHPNHYLLLSAKYSLCQLYGRIDDYLIHNMTTEQIKRKERYCREFLAVIDKLEPGLTRLRGLILYELHAPIIVLAQRLLQSHLISRKDFHRELKEVVKLLRESHQILLMEPEGSNEHQMALAAADALQRLGEQLA